MLGEMVHRNGCCAGCRGWRERERGLPRRGGCVQTELVGD